MTGGQDVLREALDKALYLAVSTLAFHGRDRGTPRQDQMLDGLEVVAQEADPLIRKALAALEQRDTSGAVGEDPIEEIAKAVCWHHFGLKWEHAERQSHADIRAMVRTMLEPTPAAASVGEGMPFDTLPSAIRDMHEHGTGSGSIVVIAHPNGDWSVLNHKRSGEILATQRGARESAGVDGVASVVVPREPTEAMLAAGEANLYDHNPTWNEPREIYRAMIAAAPIALPAGEDRHG